MYYNSNRNSNDYYNSYKRELAELEAYKKEETIQKIIKLLLTLLASTLIFVASYYLYSYFNPMIKQEDSIHKKTQVFSKDETVPKIIINQEELPQSIQLRNSSTQETKNIQLNATDTYTHNQPIASTINEKDIALIVQIIMSQMNTKTEVPLEKELEAVNHKKFKTRNLENTNHYNKVVLTTNQAKGENASLMELSNNINTIMEEEIASNSNYTQAIKKEVVYREDEMRIIIVQKGDTLSKISKKAYGDYKDYRKIFMANPEIIKNPNQIFVGQRLRVPLERG